MIEFNTEGNTVGEFLKVDQSRIKEIMDKFQNKHIFEILSATLNDESLSENEKYAIACECGFAFGQNVAVQAMMRNQNNVSPTEIH